jgi:hypothetical protein
VGQTVQANTLAFDKVIAANNSETGGLLFKLQNSGDVTYSQIKSVF